jgi:hypothetical protein
MKITNNLRPEIERKINAFNTEHDCKYVARYRGNFLYLDRDDGFEKLSPICRLTFTGDMEKWEFAIYKYSSESYEPDEWFFPGEQHVNGTIEGAMKAGLDAYA